MSDKNWFDGSPFAITVCDQNAVIVAMNERAAQTYKDEGGRALVGTDLRKCHPPAACAKLEELLRKREANVYTIRKRGIRKMIYQSPWYSDGEYAGIVELSLPIPDDIPEFIRQG